jgi:hypothetical protein
MVAWAMMTAMMVLGFSRHRQYSLANNKQSDQKQQGANALFHKILRGSGTSLLQV